MLRKGPTVICLICLRIIGDSESVPRCLHIILNLIYNNSAYFKLLDRFCLINLLILKFSLTHKKNTYILYYHSV